MIEEERGVRGSDDESVKVCALASDILVHACSCVYEPTKESKGLVHITSTYTLSSTHFSGIMAWLPEFTGCSITRELSLSQCDTTYLRLPSPAGRETTVGSDRWQPPCDPWSNDTPPTRQHALESSVED